MSDITYKWVELLMPFTTGYHQKFTGTELAQHAKIPQQSASRYLKTLTHQNWLQYERKGRNKFFSLDLTNPSACVLLQIVENFKTLFFLKKATAASLVIGEFLKHSESIILFGSYASQTQDEQSDIDLIILGKCNKEKIRKIKKNQIIQIHEQYSTVKSFAKSWKEKKPLAIEIQKKHILFGDTFQTIQLLSQT